MLDSIDGVAGSGYGAAILWTLAALVVLVIVLLIVKMIRSLTFGTFVAGGRNRKTRLAVMDATAVDSHRRLVLVRRDDIEHLLLIGGPTDVVVERDIRLAASRRANLTPEAGAAHATAAASSSAGSAATPHPAAPQPARQGAANAQPATRTPAPATAAVRPAAPASPAPAPRPATPRQEEPHRLPAAGTEALDHARAAEPATTTGEARSAAQASGRASLDDEMTRLLGELSSLKR
ncbi:MAG: hypothetical protein BGO03_10095 [Mesorhizobium sp. 61-13]|nr:flagellar biosynthetic protein FliO [Mesorhizobium sp.]OJU48002.1 MAG: hypothetical protein BGO03_10095 [Mesorhizobium sp. 61-13]